MSQMTSENYRIWINIELMNSIRWPVLLLISVTGGLQISQAQSADMQQRQGVVERYAMCLRRLSDVASASGRGTSAPDAADRRRTIDTTTIRTMKINVDRMMVGLTTHWGRESREAAIAKLPAGYLNHLQEAGERCEAASTQARRDLAQGKEPDIDIDAFASDLALIVEDCKKFGMGREIPLEIHIQNNGVVENGWSVFYKWLPGSSKFEVHEVPFPNPTPDARQTLWPGLYLVRAEKSTNGRTIRTTARNVPVSGDKVVFTITVP
jgi:hypothetical protein